MRLAVDENVRKGGRKVSGRSNSKSKTKGLGEQGKGSIGKLQKTKPLIFRDGVRSPRERERQKKDYGRNTRATSINKSR